MDAFKDTDLREALRRIYSDPPQLPADFAQRVYEAAQRQRRHCNLRRIFLWPSMAAAACIAIAFLVVVPRITEKRELSRYEGSYTVVEGQRIEELNLIKEDISEALAMAQVAEASVPSGDFVSETERAILQATDDPEMHAVVQRILQ